MKRVSNCEEPVVIVPPVLEPVEVEVALARVAPEIRDVPIVKVLPDLCRIPSMPLPLEYSQGCILIWDLKVLQYSAPSSFIFWRFINYSKRRRTRFYSELINPRIRPFKALAVN